MMRLILVGLFYFAFLKCEAQNLIPNPSFEGHSGCPNTNYQFYLVNNWFNPTIYVPGTTGTPDYFNSCATYLSFSVPGTGPYHYQYAHGGNAYAGIWIYYDVTPFFNYREYISVQLQTTLIAGQCYDFEMFVNRSNESNVDCSSYGVYFSDTLINTIDYYTNMPFIPQIINSPSNYPDSINWIPFTGQYVAHGGENYLLIGNFFDNLNTDTLDYDTIAGGGTYIYIDDVSLTLGNCVGVEEAEKKDNLTVSPNPFAEQIRLEQMHEVEELVLVNANGIEVYKKSYDEDSKRCNDILNTACFTKGVYILKVKTHKNVYFRKLIKI